LYTAFLNTFGITHRFICPHTHHQNGVVERKIDILSILVVPSSIILCYLVFFGTLLLLLQFI